MKKETPLLFSTPMIMALLKDQKNHTRRMIRGVGSCDTYLGDHRVEKYDRDGKIKSSTLFAQFAIQGDEKKRTFVRVPNEPGDLIYVREGWRSNELLDQILYKADQTDLYDSPGWKPSLHMKKKHARIWLECVRCYPQRIQSITWEECIAEGVHFDDGSGYYFASEVAMGQDPIETFRMLWYEINGVASWVANPWVWVREFKVLSKTGKP
jgi:hypothetical protein